MGCDLLGVRDQGRAVTGRAAPITCPVCKATTHHPDDIERGYCGHCHGFTRGILDIWTVYDHPSDQPDFYVARRFVALFDAVPTNDVILARDLGELRSTLLSYGLARIGRSAEDDPKIIESWI